jgi:hypothetical protein
VLLAAYAASAQYELVRKALDVKAQAIYAADFIPQMKISVVLPKLAMSKINVKKADMSLMCLCIMP